MHRGAASDVIRLKRTLVKVCGRIYIETVSLNCEEHPAQRDRIPSTNIYEIATSSRHTKAIMVIDEIRLPLSAGVTKETALTVQCVGGH